MCATHSQVNRQASVTRIFAGFFRFFFLNKKITETRKLTNTTKKLSTKSNTNGVQHNNPHITSTASSHSHKLLNQHLLQFFFTQTIRQRFH